VHARIADGDGNKKKFLLFMLNYAEGLPCTATKLMENLAQRQRLKQGLIKHKEVKT